MTTSARILVLLGLLASAGTGCKGGETAAAAPPHGGSHAETTSSAPTPAVAPKLAPEAAVEAPPPPAVESVTTPVQTAELEAAPSVDLAVHEWGLLHYPLSGDVGLRTGSKPLWADAIGDGLGELKGDVGGYGLGLHGTGPAGGKPVLYFHPGPGFAPATRLRVTVGMGIAGGKLREIWPTPEGGAQPALGTTYTWSELELLPGEACTTQGTPTRDHVACAGLDDDMGCEAASLPIWVPSTPCCLRVGGVTSSVLLYNGRGTPQAPPVRIEGDSLVNDGSATLQHVWTYHEQTLRYIAELPPGKPVALTDGAVEDLGVGLATLVRPKLVELGLFEDEADAFVRAWADTQLASPPPWRVLAFAPKALTDSLMPLRIEPSPATTLRVLAIAVD